MSKIIEVRSTPFMKNDLTNYIREDNMSNFICPTCGLTNIDCGKDGYKTAREIELKKKLEIAVKALKWIEEQADTPTQYDYDAEVILKNVVFDVQQALKEIKE